VKKLWTPYFRHRWMAAAVSLAFTLCLLEGAFRLVTYDIHLDPGLRFDSVLGWVIEPDCRIRSLSSLSEDGVNERGFRFPTVPTSKPADIRRILILGDSFTEAAGTSYMRTYPARLLERLNSEGGSWESINLAVRDWGTAQQLLALRTIGLSYQPDLIILQLFPANDFCNNSLDLAQTCSQADHLRPYLVGPDFDFPRYLNPRLSWLHRRSRFLGFLENVLLPPIGSGIAEPAELTQIMRSQAKKLGLPVITTRITWLSGEQAPPLAAKVLQQTRTLLTALQQEVAERGIPLLSIVIPSRQSLETDPSSIAEELRLDPTRETEIVETWLEELGVPTVSLRDLIHLNSLSIDDFFGRDDHLSEFGHEMVGDWIFDRLRTEGWTSSLSRF